MNSQQNVRYSRGKITINDESKKQTLKFSLFKFYRSGIQIVTVFELILRSHENQKYFSSVLKNIETISRSGESTKLGDKL